jgi:hypothetical protein
VWRFLFDAARRNHVQVFATSHSWDCIRAFRMAVAADAKAHPDDHVARAMLIRLERIMRTAKARIHAWLSVQEEPGKPLGQAITSRYLDGRRPEATSFFAWLQRALLD